jgi:hypothetical protein
MVLLRERVMRRRVGALAQRDQFYLVEPDGNHRVPRRRRSRRRATRSDSAARVKLTGMVQYDVNSSSSLKKRTNLSIEQSHTTNKFSSKISEKLLRDVRVFTRDQFECCATELISNNKLVAS